MSATTPRSSRTYHPIWTAAIIAIVACGLMPAVATADWSIGEPIVTYWGGPALDANLAQLSAAGGYNVVLVTSEPAADTMDAQLALCQQYGLRATVYSSLFTTASLDGGTKQDQLNSLIDRFKASSAAYTYSITDEPNTTQFAELAQIKSYIAQRDPDHAAYINVWSAMNSTKRGLFGPSAPANTNSTKADYTTYISDYMGTVQPELLSYDYYDFQKIGNGEPFDRPYYFYNLVTARANALAAGIPFMNIVQACAWDPSLWRNPNQNELRFQAYTSLAYGAQGISYFNYANWGQGETDTSDLGGIVQRVTGLPTQTYYDLIPINEEFKNIAEQLQSEKSIGAYHKGDAPYGTVRLPGNSPFTLETDIANTEYGGVSVYGGGTGPEWPFQWFPPNGVILSLFGDGTNVTDARYCLVVNQDYENARSVVLLGPEELAIFDAATGHWTKLGANRAELNLVAGGGILVGFASVVPEPSTVVLLGTGLAALLAFVRRRKH